MEKADLSASIRNVADFPKPGIGFKDITTLLKDPVAFRSCLDATQALIPENIDAVVGTESRGFIFGAPLADRLGASFIPARKPGKLPAETISTQYELEYGNDSLEMHRDAIQPGQKIVIIDDLLATGGTAAATARLIEELGGTIEKILFLIELTFLSGRQALANYDVDSLIKYDSE